MRRFFLNKLLKSLSSVSICPLLIYFFSSSNQAERELKRQRRKQSNRESARRSRLRKQVWSIYGIFSPRHKNFALHIFYGVMYCLSVVMGFRQSVKSWRSRLSCWKMRTLLLYQKWVTSGRSMNGLLLRIHLSRWRFTSCFLVTLICLSALLFTLTTIKISRID